MSSAQLTIISVVNAGKLLHSHFGLPGDLCLLALIYLHYVEFLFLRNSGMHLFLWMVFLCLLPFRYLLTNIWYVLLFFFNFAGKVALMKADLQGREPLCLLNKTETQNAHGEPLAMSVLGMWNFCTGFYFKKYKAGTVHWQVILHKGFQSCLSSYSDCFSALVMPFSFNSFMFFSSPSGLVLWVCRNRIALFLACYVTFEHASAYLVCLIFFPIFKKIILHGII